MNTVEKNLQRFLDGELTAPNADGLEARLRADPELARALDESRQLGDWLRQQHVAPGPTPELVWQDVQRELRLRKPLRAPAYGVRSAFFGAAVTALLAVGVGVWALLPSPRLVSAEVEYVEAGNPDSMPVVYTDHDTGWTVVWVVDNAEARNEI